MSNFIFSIIATAVIGIIWCSFHHVVIVKKTRTFFIIFFFIWMLIFSAIMLGLMFLIIEE